MNECEPNFIVLIYLLKSLIEAKIYKYYLLKTFPLAFICVEYEIENGDLGEIEHRNSECGEVPKSTEEWEGLFG